MSANSKMIRKKKNENTKQTVSEKTTGHGIPGLDTVGPVLKIVGAFEQSVKQHPLIPMGTPDPYTPPK